MAVAQRYALFVLVYAGLLGWLFVAPGQQHHWEFVIASVLMARMGRTVLLWIARPAANAQLPPLTSERALIEIAVCATAAALTGYHSLLLLAAMLIVIRIAMRFSYQSWGGIRKSSLTSVSWTLAIATLLIARLPESSR